jgi:hypothetical protein
MKYRTEFGQFIELQARLCLLKELVNHAGVRLEKIRISRTHGHRET